MIKSNIYLKGCCHSSFTGDFTFFKNDSKIKFVHAMIKYPSWKKNIDLFKFLSATSLTHLKKTPHVFFLFDASTEGFDPFEYYFFDNLYYNCKKYGVSPKKIVFVSSNLKDEENIISYNQSEGIEESINVFSFLSFRKAVRDLYEDSINRGPEKNLTRCIKKTKRFYKNYFLSLSRAIRPHRTMAQYLLYENNLDKYAILSHDKLSKCDSYRTCQNYNLDQKKFVGWANKLPLIADTEDFETNHALRLHEDLYHSSLFHIVNETHVDDFNKRSLFYSEKTFRPMIHLQPFLIFGQPYCNQKLQDYGFKIYDDYFDYSFDEEPDTKKRYLKIIEAVKKTVNHLDSLNKFQQIDWRFKNQEKLLHNFNLVMGYNLEKEKFNNLITQLEKISDDFTISK